MKEVDVAWPMACISLDVIAARTAVLAPSREDGRQRQRLSTDTRASPRSSVVADWNDSNDVNADRGLGRRVL